MRAVRIVDLAVKGGLYGPATCDELDIGALSGLVVDGLDLTFDVNIHAPNNKITSHYLRTINRDPLIILLKVVVLVPELVHEHQTTTTTEAHLRFLVQEALSSVPLALLIVSRDGRVMTDLFGECPIVLCDKLVSLAQNRVEWLLRTFHLGAESKNFENRSNHQPLRREFLQLSVGVALEVFWERVSGTLHNLLVLHFFNLLGSEGDRLVHSNRQRDLGQVLGDEFRNYLPNSNRCSRLSQELASGLHDVVSTRSPPLDLGRVELVRHDNWLAIHDQLALF